MKKYSYFVHLHLIVCVSGALVKLRFQNFRPFSSLVAGLAALLCFGVAPAAMLAPGRAFPFGRVRDDFPRRDRKVTVFELDSDGRIEEIRD